MSVEFVDANVLVYAHDGGAGPKHARAVELLERLFEEGSGALSTQVLAEFYSAAIRKLGMSSGEVEAVLADLGGWTIHRLMHRDLIEAARLHRRRKLAWWDALIVRSAQELECSMLWSENITGIERLGRMAIRNPFA
jgi:predicted nucleic acid-binding protein